MKVRFSLIFVLPFFVMTAAYGQPTTSKPEGVVTPRQMGTSKNDKTDGNR
jgi:hypothetical protein